MLQEVFTARFNEARKQNRLTLRDISDKTGISPSAIGHYSRGSALPTLEGAMNIAAALGVSLDWLCGQKATVDYTTAFSTYDEVTSAIFKLVNTPGLRSFHEYKSQDGNSDVRRNVVTITILQDEIIGEFAYKLERMMDLTKGSVAEHNLSREWAEGRMRALKGKEIIPAITPYTPPEEE